MTLIKTLAPREDELVSENLGGRHTVKNVDVTFQRILERKDPGGNA